MFKQLAQKLESKKMALVGTSIMAPTGSEILVSVDGLKMVLPTVGGQGSTLSSWRITPNPLRAVWERELTAQELRPIFERLPRSPFIWLGGMCHVFNLADNRFETTLSVSNPLGLELDLFATVEVVFWAGQNFVFRQTNRNRQTVTLLQQAYTAATPPKDLTVDKTYLSAYTHKFAEIDPAQLLANAVVSRDNIRDYVRTALAVAGAQLVNLQERSEGYTIQYRIPQVDPTEVFTAVFNHNFKLLTAGLCLQPEKEVGVTEFVSLVREGFKEGHGHWTRQWTS